MNPQLIAFWYRFHRYLHRSWFDRISIPALSTDTSYLRFGLAYQEVCSQLEIDENIPEKQIDEWPLDFIYRFVAQPDRYLRTAGICLSTRPKAEFFDAALMRDKEISFAKKMCNAMSLNQRFVCANQFQLSSYEAGALLLNADIISVAKPLWKRVKLSIDAKVVDELDAPEGAMDLHQSVLKRLWKSVDQFIVDADSEETAIAA